VPVDDRWPVAGSPFVLQRCFGDLVVEMQQMFLVTAITSRTAQEMGPRRVPSVRYESSLPPESARGADRCGPPIEPGRVALAPQTQPCASMASATLTKPAIFAPRT
jgi:hypothetical protein